MRRTNGRQRHTLIRDPATHPHREVILRVAAEFLGLDPRTLRARIEAGQLTARRSGKVYRIAVAALVAYRAAHIEEGIDA